MEKINFRYGRKHGFHTSLSLLRSIQSPTILEVGMMRSDEQAESDGHSTKVFADFIRKNPLGGNLISIDVYGPAITYCTTALTKSELMSDQISLVCANANEFISNKEIRAINKIELSKIDLLYMDGWDYSGSVESKKASEDETLKFILSAEKLLSDTSLILFDDVYNETWDGKGKKAIPYLLSNGWMCVFVTGNQALLIKNIYS